MFRLLLQSVLFSYVIITLTKSPITTHLITIRNNNFTKPLLHYQQHHQNHSSVQIEQKSRIQPLIIQGLGKGRDTRIRDWDKTIAPLSYDISCVSNATFPNNLHCGPFACESLDTDAHFLLRSRVYIVHETRSNLGFIRRMTCY